MNELLIKEDCIMIRTSSNNQKYYEKLGYVIPKRLDKRGRLKANKDEMINVAVKDVPKKSELRVTKICDLCGEQQGDVMLSLIYSGRERNDGLDICNKCRYIRAAKTRITNVKYEKSLEFMFPKIALEFHPTRNGKVTPDKISARSVKKYWWICPRNQDHEYDTSPDVRATGSNCPYCAGHRVNHTNCIAITHPDILISWDYNKNTILDPYNFGCR